MKITKTQLKWIIKEELARITNEGSAGDPIYPAEQELDQDEIRLLTASLVEIGERIVELAERFSPSLWPTPAEAYDRIVEALDHAGHGPEPEVDFENPDVAIAQ